MKPIEQLGRREIEKIAAVFFDIDDTFSLNSKILPQAYQALWDLKDAGIRLVPITGRPAGWCDHIARMWPVDAIVGENGAFFFWCDPQTGAFQTFYNDNQQVRAEKRRQLNRIKDDILSSIPGTGIASDQNYREADLAIDFCEDVPPLGKDKIQEICNIFIRHGAVCKISSIHVNGWFGRYSKIEMTRKMAAHLWKVDLEQEKERYVFCGDSPNDEPMFKFFPISVGVNNVLDFEADLTDKPAYITKGKGGIGFAEMANHILRNRV